MNKKILIWAIVLLFSIQIVFAIGVRPAKTNIVADEVSSTIYSGSFVVVNNDHQDINVKIYVEGEFEDYFTITDKELSINSNEDYKRVNFEIDLSYFTIGTYENYIVVEQTLSNNENQAVSSKIVLKHKVIIVSSYPEKYIESKLNINDKGSYFELVSEVENLGDGDVSSVKTDFYINDKEIELSTDETYLSKGDNKLLKANLEKTQIEYGEFEVLSVTHYDGMDLEIVKKLMVGNPQVDIIFFDPYFIANKVNKFSLELYNQWNTKLENVFIEVIVKKNGLKVDGFRTPSFELDPLVKTNIDGLFDAKAKDSGEYTFDLSVYYEGTKKIGSQTFQTELVSEGDINIFKTKVEGNNESSEKEVIVYQSADWGIWGYLLIAALLITIIFLMILFLVKSSRQNE